MARIRTVKPEFWTDERLTECSMSARLMFIGMLNFSDDNGNQAYSAKRLKMQIFPADAVDTQPLINELLAHGVIIEYSVNSEKYLHIKGFLKHQLINRPSASSTPKPNFTECSVSPPKQITDGVEGSGKERSNTAPNGFDDFWKTYPKRTAKPAALKAFRAAKINGHLGEVLLHVGKMSESDDWKKNLGQFIPNPATYLNQRRWEDESALPAAQERFV